MDEVLKMYAMSADNNHEPAEMDPEHDNGIDEDEEVETSSVLTSSDDDEGVVEEAPLVLECPRAPPAKHPPKKLLQKRQQSKKRSQKSCSEKGASQKSPGEKGCGQKGRSKSPPPRRVVLARRAERPRPKRCGQEKRQ